jgi:hypothetical protein
VLLFAGSLVGGLAATGRLNHEGVANLPLLNLLFPAPPPPPPAGEGEPGTEPPAAGETAPATQHGEAGAPTDASHAGGETEPQDPEAPRRAKTGRSVTGADAPPAGEGQSGGGHGEPSAGDADAGKGGHDTKKETKPAATGGAKDDVHPAEQDFAAREHSLAEDRKNKYAPGGYFTFQGMPSGFTPEQLNEAWQRVRDAQGDLDRRRIALELREQELQDLADEVGRRQQDLARERTKIVELHRDLDQRIEKFQDQVKLVRNDEVAALKRNAQMLAAFEPSKTAELIQEQWKTEKGQDEVLKTLEFMDKERVNEIVAVLPNPMIQELLKKRLRVSKEATPAAPGKK